MKSLVRSLAVVSLLATACAAGTGCSSSGSADDENGGSTTGAATAVCSDSSTGDQAGCRPPQFVLLAFDGSLNLDFWAESRQFAKDNNIKFTYFASGPYFLSNAKKAAYHGPHHSVGASDIGFGGDNAAIQTRLNHMKMANAEGHAIESHACGHFDGSAWTADDWKSDFDQFEKLIFHAGENNGFTQPDLGFGIQNVKGFRAPLLGFSSGLYTTLAAKGFTYDTSKSNATNYWPKKINGIWDFPLAQFRIVGSGKRTLSMDYNFYYSQSAGVSKPENKEIYKKEMIDTYMAYFEGNYFGNRAPVSIGHHFSKWNGGAYWEAMQTVAKKVCGQPEVKCVTYPQLVKFMETHASLRDGFAATNFTALRRPPGASDPVAVEAPVAEEDLEANGFVGDVAAAHEENDDEAGE